MKISAPEQVFEPHGARGALEAYLRLCSEPGQARADDVVTAFRMPSRGLPLEAEERVAELLRQGLSFTDALASVQATARQRARLDDAGTILDALSAMSGAKEFISFLRGPGELDEYFAAYEQTFAGTERIELEVLEQSEREAAGQTVAEYAARLQARSDRLRAVRDDVNGLELTTIHRAKGRQWPAVHVFAAEEGQLPHRRALEVGAAERAAGEGLEAERRLAYVAFTRAQRALMVHTSRDAASRFLTEAGLTPSRPWEEPSPRRGRGSDARTGSGLSLRSDAAPRMTARSGRAGVGELGALFAEAERVGLAYALRTAPSRRVALDGAAAAVERRLVGPQTASARLTVAELLAAVEDLKDGERARVIMRAQVDGGQRVTQLDGETRSRLADALRELASGAGG